MRKLKKLLSLIIAYSIIISLSAYGAEGKSNTDIDFAISFYYENDWSEEYGMATSFGWVNTNKIEKRVEKELSNAEKKGLNIWQAFSSDYAVKFNVELDYSTSQSEPKMTLEVRFYQNRIKINTFSHYFFDKVSGQIYELPNTSYPNNNMFSQELKDEKVRASIYGGLRMNRNTYTAIDDLVYVFIINDIPRKLPLSSYKHTTYIKNQLQERDDILAENRATSLKSYLKSVESEKNDLVRFVAKYNALAKRASELGLKTNPYEQSYGWLYKYVNQANRSDMNIEYVLDSSRKHLIYLNPFNFYKPETVNGYTIYGIRYYRYIMVNGNIVLPKKDENGYYTKTWVINGKEYEEKSY